MPRNFSCPTCGAPLHYDGDDASVRCAYCDNTVIVPAELRGGAGEQPEPEGRPLSFDLSGLLQQAGQFGEVARLVQAGQKIEAIKRYRELTGVGLKEAKDAVEQLAEGKVLQVSRLIVQTGAVSTGTLDGAARAEIRRLLVSGNKIEAIKLYRQRTGLGLKEAKDAVEAWEARLSEPEAEPSVVLATPEAPDTMEKLAQVRNVLAGGDRIEAIRLFREHFGVGLREAKEAVQAMERAQPVPPWTMRPAPVDKPRKRRAPAARLNGFGLLLALVAGVALCAVLSGAGPLMLSGSFRQAAALVRADPAVRAALGQPVDVVWWRLAWGQIRCSSTCSANYSFTIAGPRGEARVQVLSDSTGGFPIFFDGEWTPDLLIHYADDAGTIEVRATAAPPPPTLTLSLADADATAGADARATRQVVASVTAQALARASATAAAEATVTAQALADLAVTAQAEATARSLSGAQAGWRTVAITETYTDNRNFWPLERFDDGSLVLEPSIADGVYRWGIQPASGGHYWNLLPGAVEPVTDFVASVDVRLASGGQGGQYIYGLTFRAEGRDYGLFGLTSSGSFRVLGVFDSAIYHLYDLSSAAIRTEPGAFNRLTVRALGPDFAFEINGQTVFIWNQPDLNDGRVGLGVDIGREGSDAVIEFDNFEVIAP